MDPTSYGHHTVRILPPMVSYYADPRHHVQRHHQPVLLHQATYLQTATPAYAVPAADARGMAHFSTVNPVSMKHHLAQHSYYQPGPPVRHQQATKSQSALNALFTWKRKTKNNAAAGEQKCGHHHAPADQVPASLAQLFVAPNGTVKSSSQTRGCICAGLTESTFKAPSYFEDDDERPGARRDAPSCKKTFKERWTLMGGRKTNTNCHKSSGTLRSLSTDSIATAMRPFNTISEKRLNAAKSMEIVNKQQRLTSHGRKSILECDINPYELILDEEEANKDEGKKKKISVDNKRAKSATVTMKSSRARVAEANGTRTPQTLSKGRGIFDPANSVRIAGQTVYASMKFELEVESKHSSKATSMSNITRSKSIASFKSDWSFEPEENVRKSMPDVQAVSPATPKKFVAKIIEPEPDYDLEDGDDKHLPKAKKTSSSFSMRKEILNRSKERLDRLTTTEETTRKKATTSLVNTFRSYGRRAGGALASMKQSRTTSNTTTVAPANAPPPPPPPPPPPGFFQQPSTFPAATTSDDLLSSSQTLKPLKAVAAGALVVVDSYQNELKEKLNRGVRSILKKTPAWSCDSESLCDLPSHLEQQQEQDGEDCSESSASPPTSNSFESRLQLFESQTLKPRAKKHVHFRIKRAAGSYSSLSRSRSASHIITETIEEEEVGTCDETLCSPSSSLGGLEDGGNYYDDVTETLSRSVDDLLTQTFQPDGHDLVSSDCELQHLQRGTTLRSDMHHGLQDETTTSAQQVELGDALATEMTNNHSHSTSLPTYRTSINISGNTTMRSNSSLNAGAATSSPPAASGLSLQVVEFDESEINNNNNGSKETSMPVLQAQRTPPPIPARRSSTMLSSASSRTLSARTSVPVLRSMQARQATTVSRSVDVSRHRRSNLLNAFQRTEPQSNNWSPNLDEMLKDKSSSVDEHIYEELDIYSGRVSSSSSTSLPPPSHPPPPLPTGTEDNSFFPNRISRAEILDYLHDARGRLEQRIKEMEDALEDEEEDDILIEDDYDDKAEEEEEEVENKQTGAESKAQTLPAAVHELSTNTDSGNSSLCLGEEYADTMTCYMAANASKCPAKSKLVHPRHYQFNGRQKVSGEQAGQPLLSSAAHRRARVSNVSNASSESSATSGVSVSALDDTEDDGITTSSSSLGSGNFSPTGAYYGTGSSTKSIDDSERKRDSVGSAIERNDSGVGVDLGKSSLTLQVARGSKLSLVGEPEQSSGCFDCDLVLQRAEPLELCLRCKKRRNERKEIISEMADTELKYGRDLKIILEEFARPISVAGLLTHQQVAEIFLNLDELIEVNCAFAERLRAALNAAYEQGDEDLITVSIGELFHECLLAKIDVFERYCIRQASASLMLNQLEKEKELLRVFLRVSQMENALLRRMNLRSFLVVPVQRVTKYPLLLSRLHKVTPHHYADYDSLREAQIKLEFHLESINQKTRGSIAATTSRIWRRISNLSSASIKGSKSATPFGETLMDDIGFVRLKKVAMDLLKDWPKGTCHFVITGKLSYSPMQEQSSPAGAGHMSANTFTGSSGGSISAAGVNTSSKIWSSKTIKFSNVFAALAVRSSTHDGDEEFSGQQNIQQSMLMLFKVKNGRYILARDIINLALVVVSNNANEIEGCEEVFELHELESKKSFCLKAESPEEMNEWLDHLRSLTARLGQWRRRRNALPNIMVLRNFDEIEV